MILTAYIIETPNPTTTYHDTRDSFGLLKEPTVMQYINGDPANFYIYVVDIERGLSSDEIKKHFCTFVPQGTFGKHIVAGKEMGLANGSGQYYKILASNDPTLRGLEYELTDKFLDIFIRTNGAEPQHIIDFLRPNQPPKEVDKQVNALITKWQEEAIEEQEMVEIAIAAQHAAQSHMPGDVRTDKAQEEKENLYRILIALGFKKGVKWQKNRNKK